MNEQADKTTESTHDGLERRSVTGSLGELIRIYRENAGLPRTKLAEFTGISPNSMVKYEKAGEPEGQFPSSIKLAKICEVLEIDPREAFDRIAEYSCREEHGVSDNPFHSPFSFSSHFRSDAEWTDIKLSIKDAEDIEDYLYSLQYETHLTNQRLARIEAAIAKNGSDHEDPSRSENSTSEPEVVGATSSNQPTETEG